MSVAPALAERVANEFWWHSIDLGDGLVTPGRKSLAEMEQHWAALEVPDLRGVDVLDVGARDGDFSFRAERAGAARVVAVDTWGCESPAIAMDGATRLRTLIGRWGDEWREQPDHYPIRGGFELAREVLGSRVEAVAADWMLVDLERLGTFDVCIFSGLLYHLLHPIAALQRLRTVTRELAIIETHGLIAEGLEDEAIWRFLPGDELLGDPTNWWVPNLRALLTACATAGFRDIRTVIGPPPAGRAARRGDQRLVDCRLLVHARP